LEPVGDVWVIRQDGDGILATFPAGAQAEAAARAMGERYAEDGDFVHLKVMLPNGKVGGRYLIMPKGDGPAGGASQALLTVAA
jgi:hypothetical protein